MPQATAHIDDDVIREAARQIYTAAEYNRFSPWDRLWGYLTEQFGRALAWLLQNIAPWIPETGVGRWLLVILIAVLLTLALWLGVTFWRQRDTRLAREQERLHRPEHTFADAERLAALGRFTDAAHILYAALLAAVGRRGHVRLHPSKTIGDYLRELRRASSPLLARFRDFARAYELVIYGLGECDRERYDRLRSLALPLVQGTEQAGA